ncbi:MAG TPA: archease [bacterium]|jgi:SHS2 domain-containing protein
MSDALATSYRIEDHSGDFKLEAWGRDCLEALASASQGLVQQIVSLDQIEEREQLPVTVRGDDQAERLIAFLNELLYLVYTRHWLPRRVKLLRQCSQKDCTELEAVLTGEPLDAARHEVKYDIKAVTYHNFQIREEGGITTLEFVCDL